MLTYAGQEDSGRSEPFASKAQLRPCGGEVVQVLRGHRRGVAGELRGPAAEDLRRLREVLAEHDRRRVEDHCKQNTVIDDVIIILIIMILIYHYCILLLLLLLLQYSITLMI